MSGNEWAEVDRLKAENELSIQDDIEKPPLADHRSAVEEIRSFFDSYRERIRNVDEWCEESIALLLAAHAAELAKVETIKAENALMRRLLEDLAEDTFRRHTEPMKSLGCRLGPGLTSCGICHFHKTGKIQVHKTGKIQGG